MIKPLLRLEGSQFLLSCLDVGRVLRAGGSEDKDELFTGTHSVCLQALVMVMDNETFIRNVGSLKMANKWPEEK